MIEGIFIFVGVLLTGFIAICQHNRQKKRAIVLEVVGWSFQISEDSEEDKLAKELSRALNIARVEFVGGNKWWKFLYHHLDLETAFAKAIGGKNEDIAKLISKLTKRVGLKMSPEDVLRPMTAGKLESVATNSNSRSH